MKTLLGALLLISVALNLYLGYRMSALSGNPPATEPQTTAPSRHTVLQPGEMQSEPGPSPAASTNQPADPLRYAESLFQQQAWHRLQVFVQQHLQAFPNDLPMLLMEGRLVAATSSPAETLLHYYGLLDLTLSDEQRIEVTQTIRTLAEDNIAKLKAVKAWDILATFVEPLWQFEPDKRPYVVSLAEAYARQNMVSLTEQVLASMVPEDPDAMRIRRLLANNQRLSDVATPDIPPSAAAVSPAIPLRRAGDHFIVNAHIGDQTFSLLLDTGASSSVLSQQAFASLSRRASTRFVGRYRIDTAGGSVVAPVYQVSDLRVTNRQVTNPAVVVLPVDDFGGAQGLLGMNFLREFAFVIDQQQATLSLAPAAQ